jgi:hypothetical protein
MTQRCAIHPDRAAEITCARCGTYSCFECVGPTSGGICGRCRMRMRGGAGQLAHVPVLGIVTLVHGAMTILTGFMWVGIGTIFLFMPESQRSPNDPPGAFFFAIFGALGLFLIVPGMVQLVAGVRMRSFRNRTLAIVAMGSCVLSLFMCSILGILSVALMVWGLIVLLDAEVKARFESQDAR